MKKGVLCEYITQNKSINKNTMSCQSLASCVTYSQLQDFFFISDYLVKKTYTFNDCYSKTIHLNLNEKLNQILSF